MTVEQFDPSTGGAGYLYLKLADYIASLIIQGYLRPGSRLTGEREMAAWHGVSVGTVRSARVELQARGLVVTLPAKGTYVAPGEPALASDPHATDSEDDSEPR